MSTTIDERVVEMRFDNKRFEENVSTTMSTLEKLKQSLNLTGASKGLENVSAAAKNCDVSGIGSAVETVQSKFSALEIMGVTALMNITNSAVNAGKKIVSALTIDPIKTGFSEYETQINAVQTILANTQSKGTTLDDVNKALDELNAYADKTIYNFTEMTRNIGTFTAAGVDLDTATNAIQGIANLAAVSGSTSQQASTAMYQLSQALSSGTVKLMDWNSVVNAGMGGQVFQDALKETARVHGIAIDDMIEEQGSFRETLSEGWLSAEILTETLQKFTMSTEGLTEAQIAENREMLKSKGYTDDQIDAIFELGKTATDAATKVKTFTQLWDTLKEAAQSGWTQTWEILVGDFEEAKSLLTNISNVVGDFLNKSAQARNELLQGWKDAGGRTTLIDSFANVFHGILSVVKPIKGAFEEIIPPITVQNLLDFTNGFKKFTEKLTLGEKASNNLKRTFKGVFAVVDILRQAFLAIVKAIVPLFGGVDDLGGGILSVTAKIGDWLVKLNELIKSSGIFTDIMGGVVSVVKIVGGAIFGLLKVLKDKLVMPGWETLQAVLKNIQKRMTQVGDTASSMKTGVTNAFESLGKALQGSSFYKFLQSVWNGIVALGTGLMKMLGSFAGGAIEKLSKADFSGILDFINTISLGGIAVFATKFVKGLADITESVSGITGVLDEVKGCFEAYQKSLKADALMKIAKAIAILTAALVVLSLIDGAKLAAATGAITVLFTELMTAMAVFTRISGSGKGLVGTVKGMLQLTSTANAMIKLAGAVLLLSVALRIISGLDPEEMTRGLLGIAGLMAIVVVAAKALGGSKGTIKGAQHMIMFAAAVVILASACKSLSALSWEELGKGLVGVGGLLAMIALFMGGLNALGGSKRIMSTGVGMIFMAASLKVFASAVKDFAEMSWEDLGRGLTGMAGALAAVVLAMNLLPKNTALTGVGLIAVAAAIVILAAALKIMSSMSWEEIGKGVVVLGGALLALSLGLTAMMASLPGAAALVVASGALILLAAAMKIMGSMEWGEIGKGLTVLAGSLLILAVGLTSMIAALPGAAALLVAAAALAILAPVMKILGSMSWEGIAKGLLSIAGIFVVLGAAGLVLGPLVPVIIALSGAVALLGVGCLSVGVGLLAFSAGLAALAVSGTAGGAALVSIVVGLLNLIPLAATKLGEGLLALCDVVIQGAPAICEAITVLMMSLISALNTCVPPLMQCVGLILSELLALLVTYVPQIADVGLRIILGLLQAIAEHIDDITVAAADVVVAFIRGISDSLPDIIQAGVDLVLAFVNGVADSIRENTVPMTNAFCNLGDAMIDGLVSALAAGVTNVVKTILGLGKAILDGIKGALGIHSPSTKFKEIGTNSIQGLINGFKDKMSSAVNTIKELPKKCLSALKEKLSDFKTVGKNMAQGVATGLKNTVSSVVESAKSLGSKALTGLKNLLGIKSPSREFAEIGRYSVQGLANGLTKFARVAVNASTGVGEGIMSGLSDSIAHISDLIEGNVDTQPTIRPVLDLSGVRSSAGSISRMLGSNASVGLMANVGAISSMMAQRGHGGNSEVVSAIDKLRKDVSKVGGTTVYTIGDIRYDEGSSVANAIKTLVKAAEIERRV